MHTFAILEEDMSVFIMLCLIMIRKMYSKNIMVSSVILFGSTGSIGKSLKKNIDLGMNLITIGREGSNVEIQCNMDSYKDIARCMRECIAENECAIVVSCLGARHAIDCDRVDGDMNCNIVRACEEMNEGVITRFVLLSGACVDNPKIPLQHAKIRSENALIDSGIEYCIFRPTCFFKCFQRMWDRACDGKKIYVIGKGDYTTFGPMDEKDVAKAMIEYGLDVSKNRNSIIYLDGEEQYNAKSIANELQKDNVKHIPFWFVNGFQWLSGWILPKKIHETIKLVIYYNSVQMNLENANRCVKLKNGTALSYFNRQTEMT